MKTLHRFFIQALCRTHSIPFDPQLQAPDLPNIHHSGSVSGMAKQCGWKRKHLFLYEGFYYYFGDLTNADEIADYLQSLPQTNF